VPHAPSPPTTTPTPGQEGAPRAECYTPAVLAAISADPANFAAPGGESQAAVERRVTAFLLSSVLPRLEPGGPPAVVVAHGLAIKWCAAPAARG
jgi:broad specificity phosphatase PhoE